MTRWKGNISGLSAGSSEKVHDVDELANFMRRLMMQTSARNQFLGRVTGLNLGPINAEVSVDIGGGDQMTALITRASSKIWVFGKAARFTPW